MSNPLKEALLGQGWAGKTITRAETAERLDPLLEQHIHLNHYYAAAQRQIDNASAQQALGQLLKTARTDVGKLSETILSCGATAYNGTDLEPEDFELDGTPQEKLETLEQMEKDFRDALSEELDTIEHQMRTRSVLRVVRGNSEERLSALRQMTRATRS